MWHPYRDDIEYYEERARGLLASAWDGVPGALEVFDDVPLTEEGAHLVLAQAHGCESWKALQMNIRRPRPFARAYQAVELQHPDELKAIITRDPWLVKASGTNGNDLLGLSAAKCDERLVKVLLDDGADINHQNVHGWTALHQAAYANLPQLARLLLDRGARTDLEARGEGGTPLTVALFWGNRETAELLGVHPPNLRTAAGLGNLDLATEPEAKRGYYRPHSGFPRWWPTGDPQEVLDEALSWAARNDRTEVFGDLLKRGARIDADVYRGTALGVVRAAADPDKQSAEFAILVRSDLKGQGLGRLLMEKIVDYCRSRGIGELEGTIIESNDGMIALARRLGFRIARGPEPETVVARLPLR